MLSGVRSQIAIKIFGDDLDTLRAQAESLRQQLSKIGAVDLEIEKQVRRRKSKCKWITTALWGLASHRPNCWQNCKC